jgi:hypothetical protein
MPAPSASPSPSARDWLPKLATAGLLMLAVLLVGRVALKQGGLNQIDFHSYWYAGIFLREGVDPYRAWEEGLAPTGTVHFLDGVSVPGDAAAIPGLATVPANTAPLVMVISPLSWFSWPVASRLWMMINIGLGLLLACLVLAAVRPQAGVWSFLVVAGLLFSLMGTREALETGQTTLIVLALMMGAHVTVRRHPWLAGILLGFALSKYSLAFPLALLWLLQRRWRPLLLAGGVQVAGLFILWGLDGSNPITTLGRYWAMIQFHADMVGMHLRGGLLAEAGVVGLIVVGLLTLLVGGVTAHALGREDARRLQSLPADAPYAYLLLVVIVLWNLLAIYHRRYDHAAVILYLALVLFSQAANGAGYGRWFRKLQFIAIAQAAIWSLPIYAVIGNEWYVALFTVANLLALAGALLLLQCESPPVATPGSG